MRAISIAVLVAGLGATSWFMFHGVKHTARTKPPRASVVTTSVAVSPTRVASVSAAAETTAKAYLPTPVASVALRQPATADASEPEGPYLDVFMADAPAVAASWKYQNAIRAALARLPASSVTLESIDCHSRLCKVQLLFDSVRSDMQTLKDVFLVGTTDDFPNGFGAFAAPKREQLANGGVRTTLYLAREGEIVVDSDANAEVGP